MDIEKDRGGLIAVLSLLLDKYGTFVTGSAFLMVLMIKWQFCNESLDVICT